MNEITEKGIGTAIEVHKTIGRGLLEQEAQLLTYLRLGGWPVGLLINFNVPVLRDGIKRIVLNCKDASASSAPLR